MESIMVHRKCPWCGEENDIECDKAAWEEYQDGALIQDAFPQLDVVTREMLISGMCSACQAAFYNAEDEDDDNENPCDGICDLCSEGDTCPGSDLLAK